MYDFQEDQETTIPPLMSTSSNRILGFEKDRCSRFRVVSWRDYARFLANEEMPTSTAEIIRRANPPGTPSRIKSYSSFTEASHSVLKKIASSHAGRRDG
jgi:hypothetical protein